MKIGIIGAGQIGGTLTRLLTKLGYEVFVANSRGPASLADLARETGAQAVSVREAARAGEVVVVTIPEAKIRDLPRDMFAGVPDEVVVIDTGNYYPRERDGRIGEIEAGITESRWVANQLGRPVVKAFNNIYAQHLLERGRPLVQVVGHHVRRGAARGARVVQAGRGCRIWRARGDDEAVVDDGIFAAGVGAGASGSLGSKGGNHQR